MSDKNLAQAILHDAGRAMYNDDQLHTMSDAEVRRAGAKNLASFAGFTAVAAAVAVGGYAGLHDKFQDPAPKESITVVDQQANPAPMPVTAESADRVSPLALGEIPAGQTTYVATP